MTALIVASLVLGFRQPPVLVDSAEVARGPFRITVEEEGRTRVRDRYDVSSPVAGQLARVLLEPGDTVARGNALFVVEPLYAAPLDARGRAQAEASVARAEAALQAARTQAEAAQARAQFADSELARVQPLVASGHLPALTLDRTQSEARQAAATLRSARFAIEVARHERDSARAQLSVSGTGGAAAPITVASPIDATVLRRVRQSEGAVQPGEAVLVLGDLESIEVEIDVLSPDAVRLRPAMAVELERWGGDGILPGRVRRIEPAGFTKISALGVEEQRVWVFVDIDAERERWRRLGDGFRVEARFVLSDESNILQAPAAALFREGERWGAYVIADGRAHYRTVTPGRRSGLSVEILDGLSAGERVLLHPGQDIVDGTRVNARTTPGR